MWKSCNRAAIFLVVITFWNPVIPLVYTSCSKEFCGCAEIENVPHKVMLKKVYCCDIFFFF